MAPSAQIHPCECPGSVATEAAEVQDSVSQSSEPKEVSSIYSAPLSRATIYPLASPLQFLLKETSWRPASPPGLEPASPLGHFSSSSFSNDTSCFPIAQPGTLCKKFISFMVFTLQMLAVPSGKQSTPRRSARHTENGKCFSGEYKMQLL